MNWIILALPTSIQHGDDPLEVLSLIVPALDAGGVARGIRLAPERHFHFTKGPLGLGVQSVWPAPQLDAHRLARDQVA